MSDAELDALLTKLRNGRTSGHWAELQSAADAIEQLRAERDEARLEAENYRNCSELGRWTTGFLFGWEQSNE